jgi:hypothetical protein
LIYPSIYSAAQYSEFPRSHSTGMHSILETGGCEKPSKKCSFISGKYSSIRKRLLYFN